MIEDRIHDFRYSMSPRLGRKCLDQEDDANATNYGNQDHQRAPRRSRRMKIGIVYRGETSEEKQIVDNRDKCAKEDCAEPGDNTDDDRNKRKDEWICGVLSGGGYDRIVHCAAASAS